MKLHTDHDPAKPWVDFTHDLKTNTLRIGVSVMFEKVELDELGVNLLVDSLRSTLEDMRRHREQALQDRYIRQEEVD